MTIRQKLRNRFPNVSLNDIFVFVIVVAVLGTLYFGALTVSRLDAAIHGHSQTLAQIKVLSQQNKALGQQNQALLHQLKIDHGSTVSVLTTVEGLARFVAGVQKSEKSPDLFLVYIEGAVEALCTQTRASCPAARAP